MMRFRKRLFTVLALLIGLGMCWLIGAAALNWGEFSDQTAATGGDREVAETVGAMAWLAESSVYLCVGIPLFFLFALLGWRNSVGLREEKRHQERLQTGRGEL
jgi:hypothetical protein